MRKVQLARFALLLFACVWFSGIAMAASTLVYGNRNESIAQMQKRLKELGYFTEDCTGYFGDVTKTAIENFQKANKLSVTGLADLTTVETMKSETAVTKQQYIEQINSCATITLTLSPGDSGKLVKKLQECLIKLGYFGEASTGNYGSVTEYAVRYFQLVNGISVTGVADPATLTKLVSPSAIPVGDNGKNLTLKYGDSGSDVRILQLYLKELGYFQGDCSAKFGKNTQEAVTLFQKYNRMETSGQCDVPMRLLLLSGNAVSREKAEQAEAERALAPGEVSESVKSVKTRLSALGYYTADIDTSYNTVLAEAVMQFQTANGLPADGVINAQTRIAINSGSCVSMAGYVEKLSNTAVRLGDAGASVVLLQKRLAELGYYKGDITGKFDKATESAVIFFQRGHLMSENGAADEATRERMNRADAYTYAEAEAQYYERKRKQEYDDKLKTLCDTALLCVSKIYTAGKAGPEAFGNAGLVYYCFGQIGVELAPTIALQLDAARLMPEWNEDVRKVEIGQQVFLAQGEQVFTGIYIGDAIFVYASPSHEMIIAKENIMSAGDYVFVGSIAYF